MAAGALTIAPVLASPLQCDAAGYRSVVVTATDGSESAFAFSPTLTFTFTDEALKVRDENIEVDVPRDMFSGFYVSESEASVNDVYADPSDLGKAVLTDTGVKFSGLSAGTVVEIFTADGKLAGTRILAEPDAFLPYQAFFQGINIVKTTSLTFKILVK